MNTKFIRFKTNSQRFFLSVQLLMELLGIKGKINQFFAVKVIVRKFHTLFSNPVGVYHKYKEKMKVRFVKLSGGIPPIYRKDYDKYWNFTSFENKTILDLEADYKSTAYYCTILEQKSTWDRNAETVKDDVEVRGPLKGSLKRVKKTRKYLQKVFRKVDKKEFLLDVGCGNGLYTVPMTETFNHVIGLDISKLMIKRCREKRSNLDFVMGSATDLPFKNGVFNGVMCISVLPYLVPPTNLVKALKEASRVAEDDCIVFVNFENSADTPTNLIKQILSKEGFHPKQSLPSKLRLKRYVKLQGTRALHPC